MYDRGGRGSIFSERKKKEDMEATWMSNIGSQILIWPCIIYNFISCSWPNGCHYTIYIYIHVGS